MTAPQAAGVIHSDFEKGFIRAETVSIRSRSFNYLCLNMFQFVAFFLVKKRKELYEIIIYGQLKQA